MIHSMTQNATGEIFTTAFGDLMLVTAGLSAAAVVLALFLRNKPTNSGEKVVAEA